jgi:ubiquinol-cytochrome c reductase cytochrome b subunit
MARLIEWLNHRTGVDALMHDALYENIPSGARWRYVSGSMLVFAFATQVITGLFLWMSYSPSSQTAWESVYYIQHHMTGGWLLRGIHHFMAQAMVVLLGVHLLQVVVDGAYRAPREVNYWLGLILMKIVLGLGLTGYLLPWDQKGYWATNVATNLMTLVPFIGAELQQVVLGGSEYGHHTLTRFFALHAGVLPALLVAFLGMHIAVFRRHGITARVTPGRPDQTFWPHQVLLDGLASLALLVVICLATINFDFAGVIAGRIGPEYGHGAELGAPADPSEQYSAARPEWYFLFLFQLLKYFHGDIEWVGALAIPGAVMLVLFLMPITGRVRVGHYFNVLFVLAVLVGAGVLTGLAFVDDNYHVVAERLKMDQDDEATQRKIAEAMKFNQAKEDAEREAERIIELVDRRVLTESGELSDALLIPRQGAVYLLRNDPAVQGPKLFARHCASCHDYRHPGPLALSTEKGAVATYENSCASCHGATKKELEGEGPKHTFANQVWLPKRASGKDAVERDAEGKVVYEKSPSGAPNLYGFASRTWIRGLLNPDNFAKATAGKPVESSDKEIAAQKDHPDNHKLPVEATYFGNTAHKTAA